MMNMDWGSRKCVAVMFILVALVSAALLIHTSFPISKRGWSLRKA